MYIHEMNMNFSHVIMTSTVFHLTQMHIFATIVICKKNIKETIQQMKSNMAFIQRNRCIEIDRIF